MGHWEFEAFLADILPALAGFLAGVGRFAARSFGNHREGRRPRQLIRVERCIASSSLAGHPCALRIGLSVTVELAVLWPCPGARVGLAERGDCLGQRRRFPDTGASGDAGQLCLWIGARITACPG